MLSLRLSTLVSIVIAVTATAVKAQDAASVTTCAPIKGVLDKGYHSDDMCDRKIFNQYKINVRRDQRYQGLKAEGGVQRVPNVKTVTCPTEPVNMIESGNRQGYDTTWFVENTAKTAVVLCFVDPETGKEYSAVDSKITPPSADPKAILKPGEWKAVLTYEGDVFTVRELDPETGAAGRIVLQHRVGLVPVGQGVKGLTCPEADVEPVAEKFARTDPPEAKDSRCNQIDIGFRNAANCPLHGYYIPNAQAQQSSNSTSNNNSCPAEEFKLHLGMEGAMPDFHWDWQSNTKFEGSAIGHTFAFRLASNPSILVDTVTLEPTKVIDCPAPRELTEMQITANSIILPVRFGRRHHANATAESLLEYYANATLQAEEYDTKAERVGASASRYGAASAASF